VAALTKIARRLLHLREVYAIRFDKRFNDGFDLADPFPAEMFKGSRCNLAAASMVHVLDRIGSGKFRVEGSPPKVDRRDLIWRMIRWQGSALFVDITVTNSADFTREQLPCAPALGATNTNAF
jgi:hypothetical protein